MRSRGVFVLALLCVVLVAVGAWQMGWLAAPVPPAVPPTPPPPPRFESKWATEQEWLVDLIVRDIAETAAYAEGREAPTEQALRFKVTSKAEAGSADGSVFVEVSLAAAPPNPPRSISETLSFEEHLFTPRGYERLARQLLGPVAPRVASGPRGGPRTPQALRLLSSLLDLRAEILVREDESLSKQLETDPRDHEAHEGAALLLGAFALRDAAGRSTDTRAAVCRATVHLSVARALRGDGETGLAGRFAEALLVTLVGRERDALERLDTLEGTAKSPAERSWIRALRLRNTSDWRLARDERRLTLLEEREELRALVLALDDTSALAWLDRRRPEPIPDWGLLTLEAGGASVESANRFAAMAPMLEVAEAGAVITAMGRPPSDHAALMEALNERPARLVSRDASGKTRIGVVGWGLWADRAQRHLVFELSQLVWYRSHLLGQPGQARAVAERSRQQFGRLDMYPIVLRAHAADAKQYQQAMAAVRELALRSPERLTGGHWDLLRAKESFAPVPKDLPDETTWFRPALPAGTLIDVRRRLAVLPALRDASPAGLERLRELAPRNADLADFAAARLPGSRRSAPDLATVYGALADYNVEVMGKLAFAAWYDAAEFRRRQGTLCETVPERCFLFGYRLAEMGFADEAAAAYRKGFDRADDRVWAANESRWLVDYYFDHGKLDKAEAVARRAASVYSERGLFIMARLMERMVRLGEAEEYYRRILDRYESPNAVTGFYYRQARVSGRAEYESKLRDTLALALPGGLERLDRAALPPAPTDGVVVRKENDFTKKCGIKWGHVIVGLDGFRIHDRRGYFAVLALDQSPGMKLVVWRGRSYDDVEAEVWDRNFRVELEDLAKR